MIKYNRMTRPTANTSPTLCNQGGGYYRPFKWPRFTFLKRLASHIKINPIAYCYGTNGRAEGCYNGPPVLLNKRNITSVVPSSWNGKTGLWITLPESWGVSAYFVTESVEYFEKILT